MEHTKGNDNGIDNACSTLLWIVGVFQSCDGRSKCFVMDVDLSRLF
jgi:hypothetical protein